MKYTVHLLRRTAKKCPQRIKDTPAVLFCLTPCICTVYFKRLTESMLYDMLLLKMLNVSERTGMSVVPRNGDVFAPQKLASRSVHGCTLLDRLFQKANGKWYFFRSGTDAAGSKQQSVCLQTGSPKMNKEVHFWARMSVVPRSSEFAWQTRR